MRSERDDMSSGTPADPKRSSSTRREIDQGDQPVTDGALPGSADAALADTSDSPANATQGIAELVRSSVRDEFDEVVPHLVQALKTNEAAAELARRLDVAERRLAEREARPLVAGVRKVLRTARKLDYDAEVKSALVAELEDLLIGAGYTEFGEVGELFVPGRHRALEGSVTSGPAVVSEVFEPGLETIGEVVIPALVRVTSAPESEEAESV
jgi:hypothetical protein